MAATGVIAIAAGPALGAFPGANGPLVFASNRHTAENPATVAMDTNADGVLEDVAVPDDFEIFADLGIGAPVQLTTNFAIAPPVAEEGEGGGGGGAPEAETPAPIVPNDIAPAVSPDGTRIVFTRNYDPDDGSTDPDLYIMDMDGTDVVQLTKDKPGAGGMMGAAEYEPAWSPDGTRIAYRRNDGTNADIWIIDVGTGAKTQITGKAQGGTFGPHRFDGEPAWSPDGTRIAFANGKGPTSDIWVVDLATGQAEYMLGEGDVSEASPEWSPDGKAILFRRGDEGAGGAIWSRNLTTGVETQLTDPAATVTTAAEEEEPETYSDLTPAFAPDGTLIAFASTRPTTEGAVKGDPDLYVMNADGTGQTLLDASAVATDALPTTLAPTAEEPPDHGGGPGGSGGHSTPALPDTDMQPDWGVDATKVSANLGVSAIATPPASVEVGSTLTYTLKVANAGYSNAQKAGLLITVTGASVSSVTAEGGTTSGAGPITCDLGLLPLGASRTVTLVLTADQVGDVVVNAEVFSGTPGPADADNTVTLTTTVVPKPASGPEGAGLQAGQAAGAGVVPVVAAPPSATPAAACVVPKLRLRLAHRARVRIRERLRVVLEARNGSAVAEGVLLRYRVPKGFALIGSTRKHTRSGALYTFRWGKLMPGQTARVRLTLRARTRTRIEAGTLTATAQCIPKAMQVRNRVRATVQTRAGR